MQETTAVKKKKKLLRLISCLPKMTWMYHSVSGENVEKKVELSGKNAQHLRGKRARQHQKLFPAVKHVRRNIMVWCCFAASEPEH